MQILNHKHNGRVAAGAGEQVQQRLEQAHLRQRIHGVAPCAPSLQLGQQPPKLPTACADQPPPAAQVPCRAPVTAAPQQRRIRQLRPADIDAAAHEEPSVPRAHLATELSDQSRLSHAGLARDEYRAGVTRARPQERGPQGVQLLASTYECRT